MTATRATSSLISRPPKSARPKPAVRVPLPAPVPMVRPTTHACACGGGCPRCTRSVRSVPGLEKQAAAPDLPRHTARTVHRVLAQPGQPLPEQIRQRAERQFGADLSSVRLHTDRAADAAAAQAGATAFAAGQHIVFRSRCFAPHTTEGFRRLAHELAHVLQQRGGSRSDRIDSSATLENEARAAGLRASADSSANIRVPPRAEARGRLQRDDSALPWQKNESDLLHPWTSQSEFQLKMSPEIQRMIWEMEFERWLAAQHEATPPPEYAPVEARTAEVDSETPGVPSPAEAARAAEETGGPLAPRTPIPTVTGADFESADQPDMGAIMEPYLMRNVPMGSRDADAAMQAYQNAYRWVRILPDPPAPFRSILPDDWRRSVSQSLAGAALNNSPLRFEFPTAIEQFDRDLVNLTGNSGASPTYVNVPIWSF